MARGIRLFIAGFGVVGQALAEQLLSRQSELKDRVDGVSVIGISDSRSSVSDPNGIDLARALAAKRKDGSVGKEGAPGTLELLTTLAPDVLVEVASAGRLDGEPGLTRIRTALGMRINVVSSNKMPLARSFGSLTARAKASGVALRYSGCVGGGLPFLEVGEACASADGVTKIDAVLNTTSNYVLSKMEQGGLRVNDALREARKAGYAERDASLDLRGVDAACKIVILANHVLGKNLSFGDVKTMEGVESLRSSAVESARSKGKKLRMVASVTKSPSVRLVELHESDPIAVDGASNAVRFRCERLGDVVLAGEAGGGRATSTAVMRDVLAIGTQRR